MGEVNKPFGVKGNNLAHIKKIDTYRPEGCREMALNTRSTGVGN